MATSSTKSSQLTSKQLRAIDAIIETANIDKAAQQAGVNREQVLQWMIADNAFNAVLFSTARSRQDEDFQEIMAELNWEWQ